MAVTPIFLFSLPRSGSTLLQRVVSAHEGVASVAEPWILLPLLGARRSDLPLSDAWDHQVSSAIEDFLSEMPRGAEEYDREVHDFALRLYERAASPADRYFLDKTPPYTMIIDDIMRVFPEGKFVFLWRNPLSVVASTVETLCRGTWDVSQHRPALFAGLANLVAGHRRHAARAHAVRYDDLLTSEDAWRSLMAYLELEFDATALERFAGVRFAGRMGDPTGVHLYSALSTEPLTKWRETIVNPVRREWCDRYLRWIGRDRLATMGYDLDALLGELRTVRVGRERMREDVTILAGAAAREMLRARTSGNRLISSYRALLSV
jgi:hypothetical protein